MRKKIFILILIVFFVLISGFLILKWTKRQIIKILSNSTGQVVSFEEFTLNPLKGIYARDLKVGDFLKIDTLEIGFTPLSLLNKEILRIRAEGVNIDFNKSVKGEKEGRRRKIPLWKVRDIKFGSIKTIYKNYVLSIQNLSGSIIVKREKGTLSFVIEGLEGKDIDIDSILGQIMAEKGKINEALITVTGKTLTANFRIGRVGEEWVLKGKNFFSQGISISQLDGTYNETLRSGRISVNNLVFQKIKIPLVNADFSMEGQDRLELKKIYVKWPKGILRGRAQVLNLKDREKLFYKADLWVKDFSLENFSLYPLFLEGGVFIKGNNDALSIYWDLDKITYKESVIRRINGEAKIRRDTIELKELWVEDPKIVAALRGYLSKNNFSFEVDAGITDFSFSPYKPLRELEGELSIKGLIRRDNGKFVFDISGSAENLRYKEIGAQTLFFSINSLEESLVISAYNGKVENIPYDSLFLSVSLGKGEWGHYSLRAGLSQKGYLLVEGVWKQDRDSIVVKNEKILFEFKKIKEALENPIKIVISPEKFIFETSQESIFGGNLSLLKGKILRKDNRFFLDARMDEMNLEVLSELMLFKNPVQGYLSFTIEGGGNFTSPSFQIEALISKFSCGDLENLEVYSAAEYRNGIVEISEFTIEGYGEPIEGNLEMPLEINLAKGISIKQTCPIRGRVKSNGIKANILNKLIGYLLIIERGEIAFDLTVDGDLNSPLIYGDVKLKGEEGAFSTFNTHLKNILGKAQFDGKILYLKNIYAESGEGELNGKGLLRFKGVIPDSVDFSFEVKKVKMEPDLYTEVTITGEVKVRGKIPKIWVDGNFHLDEAYLFVPFGRKGGRGRVPSPLRYSIHLTGEKEIYLLNELAEMEFSADLEIKKEDEINTVYSGRLRVLGGTFMYLDRVFSVTEGDILFQGEKEFNPSLNIRGETQIDDSITVYLFVSGTLNTPEIQLSSEPSMPTEDIISYLSFGKPLREVPLTIKDVELIRERALNLAEGFLSRELRRKLRISELELKTGLSGEDPRFTVGFYLSPSLYIRYTHDLLALEKDVFHLRYFLSSRTAIYAERDRDGEISTGIEFNFRF